MSEFDAFFAVPEVTVRQTVQIYGMFDASSTDPSEDRWDGTSRTLGKMLLQQMSDGEWREATSGAKAWTDTEMLGAYEARLIKTDSGLIFWTNPGEATRCGMVSAWIEAAMQQGNMRRAISARPAG